MASCLMNWSHELERHVTGCAECQKEREQVLALKVLADAHPVAEPGRESGGPRAPAP